MADATTITAIVMAAGAAVTAVYPIAVGRRKSGKQKDATTLASFTALNDALGREIERLQSDMDRLRDSYGEELAALRASYGKELDAARVRITELESEVGTLQRALRGGPGP